MKRIILMSASVNALRFSQYFNNCPVINIEGRTFPVESFYLEDIIELTGIMPNLLCSLMIYRYIKNLKSLFYLQNSYIILYTSIDIK